MNCCGCFRYPNPTDRFPALFIFPFPTSKLDRRTPVAENVVKGVAEIETVIDGFGDSDAGERVAAMSLY